MANDVVLYYNAIHTAYIHQTRLLLAIPFPFVFVVYQLLSSGFSSSLHSMQSTLLGTAVTLLCHYQSLLLLSDDVLITVIQPPIIPQLSSCFLISSNHYSKIRYIRYINIYIYVCRQTVTSMGKRTCVVCLRQAYFSYDGF